MTESIQITVFGGTGFVGRRLISALQSAGHRVKVAARHAERVFDIAMRSGGRVDSVRTDILDPQAVREALVDSKLAINLVGAVSLPSERAYFDLHERGARHVAQAVRDSDGTRLVHFSALGISTASRSAADRSKAAGEAAVREVFPQAMLLRPSLVYGEQDHFVSRLDMISRISPVIPLIGADTRVQPIYVGDLVDGVMRLVEEPGCDGGIYQAVGPRVDTLRHLVQVFLKVRHRQRLLLGMPACAAGALGGLLERLPEPPITRDFVALMQNDKIADPDLPTLADLGVQPRAFETWLAIWAGRY